MPVDTNKVDMRELTPSAYFTIIYMMNKEWQKTRDADVPGTRVHVE